jgi:hydroxyacylglutathione hydrolase
MDIIPLRAFEDNYIWLIRNGRHVAVVDPGDAVPVKDYLEREGASLQAILLTHHHGDHTGGVADLLRGHNVPVYGPAGEAIDGVSHALHEGETVTLPGCAAAFRVIGVPGHTRGHIAYYGGGALFCGDTLFGCGCGRLFEGTAPQMWSSLSRLASLPGDTLVYCAHEYTLSNIRFALAVESGNAALTARADEVAQLRARNLPSVPFPLSTELATNPFLRCKEAAVLAAAEKHAQVRLQETVDVFAALREWKNGFR